jgi:MoaA/NifB/PqqE/SkfB family radical SAM enzyme
MHLTFGKLVILCKWLLTERAISAAIDITNRCNLRCRHCYWWEQDHPPELGDQEMIDFMKGLRAEGLRAAILYGGEPMLRPEVCRTATRIFDATLVFTNGTNGLPELGSGQWIVSLDGTREVNDSIRGEGVYDQVVGNLCDAASPAIVHMTVCRQNQGCLDAFVRAMMELPIKGVSFSFYTPCKGAGDSRFFIPLAERNRLAKHLVSLRQTYGEGVAFTGAMARQLLTDGQFSEWNNLSSCPVSKRVRCFRSDGRPKACTYGDDADCSRCGCAAVVAYRAAFNPLDYQSLRVILGLLVPAYQPRPPSKMQGD